MVATILVRRKTTSPPLASGRDECPRRHQRTPRAQPLDGMITDLQNQREEGRSYYFQADMEGALQALAVAQEKLEDLIDEAIKARNSAAFWIFVTEWAAVTGTALLTGVAVWFLMVKRSLYREVEITRLRPNE